MRQIYHGLVADEMGERQGMIIVDESGFVKSGRRSDLPTDYHKLSDHFLVVMVKW